MSVEENKNETSKSVETIQTKTSDLRIFVISLLTTVIVLALYHLGTGLYSIYCGQNQCGVVPVSSEYMLVPVYAVPPTGMQCPRKGGKHHFRKGCMNGERRNFRKSFDKRGMRPGMCSGMRPGMQGPGMCPGMRPGMQGPAMRPDMRPDMQCPGMKAGMKPDMGAGKPGILPRVGFGMKVSVGSNKAATPDARPAAKAPVAPAKEAAASQTAKPAPAK